MKDKIPLDPEYLVFSDNLTVKKLQKWRHYAMSIVGLIVLREIEKRGLVIVPLNMCLDLFDENGKDAFNALYGNSTQISQFGQKQ